MLHAVIRINDKDRAELDSNARCFIRAKFQKRAQSCCGSLVLLYQSARSGAFGGHRLGYFAHAILEAVSQSLGPDGRFQVTLARVRYFAAGEHVRIEGRWEADLFNQDGALRGWAAAEDIRLISEATYAVIVSAGGLEASSQSTLPDYEQILVPPFIVGTRQARDSEFHRRVYLAYNGCCAISGLRLVHADGCCSLEAAHLYPYVLEPRNNVQSGVLLAPHWHDRFDHGSIIINDDYTWTAVIEDDETRNVSDRRLLLPIDRSEWPDVSLIRRRRQWLAERAK